MNEIKCEWNNYLGGSAFKSKQTIQTYHANHRRITSFLNKPIHSSSQEEIIEAANNIANNKNTKGLLLNCGIAFYNLYNLNTNLLIQEKKIITECEDKEICLDDLDKRLNYLFYKERWRDVIILYLLLNYYCRNADLNIEIVKSIHRTKHDKKRNYIVTRKEDFVFIRNNYEGKKTFGQKRNHFTSVLFARALKYYCALLPPNMPIHLLHDEEGNPVNDDEVERFVKIATEGLTEGDINKIQLEDIESRGDYELLNMMADRRGETINNLLFFNKIKFMMTDIIKI